MASGVHAYVCRQQWHYATLRCALDKATEEDATLFPVFNDNILTLNEVMEHIYSILDAAQWVRETLIETADKGSQADSTSNRSIDTGRHRRRYDPSIGRDDRKRVTPSNTSDSDSLKWYSRQDGRPHPGKR